MESDNVPEFQGCVAASHFELCQMDVCITSLCCVLQTRNSSLKMSGKFLSMKMKEHESFENRWH